MECDDPSRTELPTGLCPEYGIRPLMASVDTRKEFKQCLVHALQLMTDQRQKPSRTNDRFQTPSRTIK
jgi:hypothetical protein